jgi:hypothetical protein
MYKLHIGSTNGTYAMHSVELEARLPLHDGSPI